MPQDILKAAETDITPELTDSQPIEKIISSDFQLPTTGRRSKFDRKKNSMALSKEDDSESDSNRSISPEYKHSEIDHAGDGQTGSEASQVSLET